MPGGQAAVYEFTLYKEQFNKDGERIRGPFEVGTVGALLRAACKKFTFQLERGDQAGKLHYQGRLSLFKKTTIGSAAKLFPDSGIHLSPTATDNIAGPPFYCLKAQTKVEGPWTEADFVAPRVEPWPYNEITEDMLYPWQKELRDRTRHPLRRKIHYVHEPQGMCGKTTWCIKACCLWTPYACRVPAMNSYEDICQYICSRPESKVYIVDVPKGLCQKKFGSFFAGLETLKDGWVYDKRYKGQERFFDSPQVVVFSNKKPNLKYLSKDRWEKWTISKDKRLIGWPHDHSQGNAVQERHEEESESSDDESVLQSEVSGSSEAVQSEEEGSICEGSEEGDVEDL